MPLTDANGSPLTQAQLTALGTVVPTATVYALGTDVYEKYFLPGENTANGPAGWRRAYLAGEQLTSVQIAALYPAPVVNTVSPASGSHLGGSTVRLLGSNLTYGSSAQFGGSYATAVVVNEDATILTCVVPAHANGAVDVVVTDGSHTTTKTNGFLYT
jgi:IPT/TIG domain